MVTSGFGQSRLIILEALGGARERIRSTLAADFDLAAIDPLNTIGIEVVAGAQARIIPRAPGLADSLFEHDGQITKREIRALTLSALAPRRGERLWDIGAGAGSVAIEWMLADSSLRAIAVEADAERAARIARNAAALGVSALEVVHASVPAALAGLARPDAIFIGGGASEPGVLDECIEALPAGGRLVVNAVTLATEARLMAQHAAAGRRSHPDRDRARRAARRQDRLAAGDADHAMVLDQAMIIAGIGCRRGASANEIQAAITQALARRNLAPGALGLIATAEAKADEAGISEAAAALGVQVALIASEQLAAASANVATKSERVQELIGVPSVAEAAALAAGGTEARLLAPRIVVGPVTCALGEVP